MTRDSVLATTATAPRQSTFAATDLSNDAPDSVAVSSEGRPMPTPEAPFEIGRLAPNRR